MDNHSNAKTYLLPQTYGLNYALKHFITEGRAICMQLNILSVKNIV